MRRRHLGDRTPKSERDRRLTLLARMHAKARGERQAAHGDNRRAVRREKARIMQETEALMEREYLRKLPASMRPRAEDEDSEA